MMIGARTGAWSGKPLPYDAEVEYLESVYTQYIDTGIVLKKNDSVIIDVDIPDVLNSWQTACGVYAPTFRITSYATSTQPRGWFIEGFTLPESPIGRNVWTGRVTSTNIVVSFTLNVQHNSSQILDGYGRHIKYYSVKILRDGTEIIDLIPVRKGTVGYLYDRVSGELFGNAGTGDFIIGPDKTA